MVWTFFVCLDPREGRTGQVPSIQTKLEVLRKGNQRLSAQPARQECMAKKIVVPSCNFMGPYYSQKVDQPPLGVFAVRRPQPEDLCLAPLMEGPANRG